jgi:four helix bundle suffix protein
MDPEQPDSHLILPKHGGYRRLHSFQTARLVFDATVVFCDRFIERRSRTHDQMVQAARSGVQNIAEGSVASGTSKKTELKLTNVARASLEELILDYEDFLRQRGLPAWEKECRKAELVRSKLQACAFTAEKVLLCTPEVAANTLLCLVNQASYLLGRQIARLEADFLSEGGFTEKLHAARTKARDALAPACPVCAKPMRQRTAKSGPKAGSAFWGCTGYPDCRGTREVSDASDRSDSSDSLR